MSDVGLPSNIFELKGQDFYDTLESTFSFEIKEITRLQGYSSAGSLLYSKQYLLDFIHIKSDDSTLLLIKRLAAFHQSDDTWIIKAGIQFDADQLMSALHQFQGHGKSSQSDGSLLVSNDILCRFPLLRCLIMYCQSSPLDEDSNKFSFLFSFLQNLFENLVKSSNRYRYHHRVEQFAFILSVLSRRQAYEYVRINLPGGLPSLSTLSTIFNQYREKFLEGEFRFDSLKDHFQSIKAEYAFAAEDSTGIVRKVCYDSSSNSFVGFAPQLQQDGFPQLPYSRIDSFSDLQNAFESQCLSTMLNLHAIQPITSNKNISPPFILSAYGSDNKFQSHHIISRWMKIFHECLQRGIRILGFSTDCEPRYLRAMRLVTNFFASLPNTDLRQSSDVFRVSVPRHWHWFYLDSKQLFMVFQDPIHLATKIRNRMLSSTSTLIMGNQLISIDILHEILSMSSKLYHGLTSSDLNPRDHQNYSSCFKICRDEVIQALCSLENTDAISIYLTLLRSIIDAYIETSTPLLDRVFHAWLSVFLSRLWLIWIEKMGKANLDKILIELTESYTDVQPSRRKTSQQYFLTPQAIYSIELNAHCLTYLILLVVEGKLPQEVLAIERFHSQSCESIFRSTRAFSSNSSCGVNFTVQGFLNIADKLSVFEKIKNENEQLTSGQLRFPVHHKIKSNPSSSIKTSSMIKIPTKSMIEDTVFQAFEKAVSYVDRVGIKSFLLKRDLCDIITANKYAKVLFEDKQILDEFCQESDALDDEKDQVSNFVEDDAAAEEENSFLEYPDDLNASETTFRTKRVCDNVPPHLMQSYLRVRINDKDKFIHKSTACWVLTGENQKLSSDRTQRVTQLK